MNEYYLKDLEQLLKIRDELENCLMSNKRREQLELCLESVQIVLSMYELGGK